MTAPARRLPAPFGVVAEDGLGRFLAEIARHPLLGAAEEVRLSRAVERGDEEARRRLVESNLRLVVSIARRYTGFGLPLQDLIQEGALGLDRAAQKFDWRRGCRFSTYATWWITQAIRRGLTTQRRLIRLPGYVQDRRFRITRASRALTAELGREPTSEELADATGLTVEQVDQAFAYVDATLLLDSPIGDEGEDDLVDVVADRSAADPEEVLEEAARKVDLERALARLTERQRLVLEKHFGLSGPERAITDIARDLGLSRERVRQIEREALQTLAHSAPSLAA